MTLEKSKGNEKKKKTTLKIKNGKIYSMCWYVHHFRLGRTF